MGAHRPKGSHSRERLHRGIPVLIVYLFMSLLGACLTIALLASHSWPLAFLCAPLGGSALTLIVAIGIYAGGPGGEPSRAMLVSPPP